MSNPPPTSLPPKRPLAVGKFVKSGISVEVETGAGINSHFSDADYTAVGASIGDGESVFKKGEWRLERET